MKDNKPSNDLSSGIFKTGGEEIIKQLVRLYINMLSKKIIFLHKKKTEAHINNCRPLSLLSQANKIFTRIIENKIERIFADNHDNQPENRLAFQRTFKPYISPTHARPSNRECQRVKVRTWCRIH